LGLKCSGTVLKIDLNHTFLSLSTLEKPNKGVLHPGWKKKKNSIPNGSKALKQVFVFSSAAQPALAPFYKDNAPFLHIMWAGII